MIPVQVFLLFQNLIEGNKKAYQLHLRSANYKLKYELFLLLADQVFDQLYILLS